jgi:hypothetical protein
MKNEDKKILFGLSFPAIMVIVVLGIVLSSNKN